MQGGRIDGAEGVDEKDGTPFAARAEQVVVAAGGINGDLDRVRQNWHRDWGKPPEVLLNGSHRFADGRLHDATSAVGGVADASRQDVELCAPACIIRGRASRITACRWCRRARRCG